MRRQARCGYRPEAAPDFPPGSLLLCMDTSSQRVAAAFHGCRSGTGCDRALAGARSSSKASVGGSTARALAATPMRSSCSQASPLVLANTVERVPRNSGDDGGSVELSIRVRLLLERPLCISVVSAEREVRRRSGSSPPRDGVTWAEQSERPGRASRPTSPRRWWTAGRSRNAVQRRHARRSADQATR